MQAHVWILLLIFFKTEELNQNNACLSNYHEKRYVHNQNLETKNHILINFTMLLSLTLRWLHIENLSPINLLNFMLSWTLGVIFKVKQLFTQNYLFILLITLVLVHFNSLKINRSQSLKVSKTYQNNQVTSLVWKLFEIFILFELNHRPVGRAVARSPLEREVWGSNLGPVKLNKVLPTTRHRCNISSKGAVLPGRNDAEMGPKNSLHAST